MTDHQDAAIPRSLFFDNQIGLMTKRQLAECLNISERTIEKFCSTEDLPKHKFGKAVRFDFQEVIDWLRERRGY